MAQQGSTISGLPGSTNPPNTADILPVTQSGTTKQTTLGALFTQLKGFTQSGTGAVATTVQTKLRESVSVKDFGAVGDGTTDDTTAIQLALNSGANTVYFPDGTYKTTATLTSSCNIKLSDGATVSISGAGSGVRGALFKATGDYKTISGGKLTTGYRNIFSGIWLYNCTGFTVRDVHFEYIYQGSVCIGSNCIKTTVTDCEFHTSGYGVFYDNGSTPPGDGLFHDTGSYGLVCTNNVFWGDYANSGGTNYAFAVYGDHIEINSPETAFYDILISGNRMYAAYDPTHAAAGFGIGLAGVYNATVQDNFIQGGDNQGIHVEPGIVAGGNVGYSYNTIIQNNTIIGTYYQCIGVVSGSGIVRGNYCTGSVASQGIFYSGYSAAVGYYLGKMEISGNNVSGNYDFGIYVSGSSFTKVTDNYVYDNSVETVGTPASHGAGIILDAAISCTCSNNTVSVTAGRELCSIYLNSVTLLTMMNNTLDNAGSSGAFIVEAGSAATYNNPLFLSRGQAIYAGAGAPSQIAKLGSIYLRIDGGAGTSLYVKESNPTLTTGWVGK